ncbi:MAG: SH3 domain-containing protein [Parasulfuritortus sp.]|nr:SH3 domain-containing protein [Parasulfuritortus sp.]
MKKTLWACLLTVWAGYAMATTGTLIKAEQARATPSAKGKIITQFASGTPVDVINRQGGWLQIKAQGRSGWVRLLSVRSATGRGSGADLGGVVGLAGKRNNNQVVAVAGLRGLSEEDLKGAHFDAAQLARLDTYKTSRQQAESFAAQAKLKARNVAYLNPPPQKTAPAANNWEGRLP